jgi:hypothetical protein
MNNSAKANGLLLKSASDSQQIVSVPIHLTGIYTYRPPRPFLFSLLRCRGSESRSILIENGIRGEVYERDS